MEILAGHDLATAVRSFGQPSISRSTWVSRTNETLNLRARLHVGLAETLLASGQQQEATAILRAAVDLYRRKGNIVCARQAWELASSPPQLGGAPSASSH